LEQELSAVVFISSRPVDAFVRGGWEPDFNFLPINYESKFEDYYLPSGIRGARFVDYLFSRIDRLQAPGFNPKWKSINLVATVPGLARFSAARHWLRQPRRVQVPLREPQPSRYLSHRGGERDRSA
jgi:hypothetical protein